MTETKKKISNLKSVKKYQLTHPERVAENHRASSHKGGKRYAKKQHYKQTGIQGARNKIRTRHAMKWLPFKRIIAPRSQLHHEWLPDSSKYIGVALVEADQHRHGYIEVIKVLEGHITFMREEDLRNRQQEL